jgi:hypothetical protein
MTEHRPDPTEGAWHRVLTVPGTVCPELTRYPGFLYAGRVPTAAKEVVFQMTETCVTATTATRLAG